MVFCTYCGQSFTRDEHLERHILTHTNVKPFRCFNCHMTFARRDLLQRHYTVHGKEGAQDPNGANGIIPKSAGRTPIACNNCAKTKTKCDKKFPCSRCASRNLKCTARPTRRTSKNAPAAAPGDGEVAVEDGLTELIIPTGEPIPSPDGPPMYHEHMTVAPGELTPPRSSGHNSPPNGSPNHGHSLSSPSIGYFPHSNMAGYDDLKWHGGHSHSSSESSIESVSPGVNMFDWSQLQMTPGYDMSVRPDMLVSPTAMSFHSSGSMHSHSDSMNFMSDFKTDFNQTMASLQTPLPTPALDGGFPGFDMDQSQSSYYPGHMHQTGTPSQPDLDAITAAQDGWTVFRCTPPLAPHLCPKTARLNLEKLQGSLKSPEVWSNWQPTWNESDMAHEDQLAIAPLQEMARDKLMAITQSFLHKALDIHKYEQGSPSSEDNSSSKYSSNFVLLPPSRVLDHFFRSYTNNFELFFPLTSKGSLNTDELMHGYNDKASSLMLLLMIAQGASTIPGEARWLTSGLTEACRISLFDLIEKNISMASDSIVLRSALIFTVQAAWSGDKWLMDIAAGQRGMYFAMLRHSGIMEDRQTGAPTNELCGVDMLWNDWVDKESRSRLIYSWAMVDQDLSLLHDTAPLFSVTEFGAPMPDSNVLWRAKSASQWSSVFEQVHEFSGGYSSVGSGARPLSLRDLFRHFLDDTIVSQGIELTPLQLRLLLHPLQSLVCQFRQLLSCFSDSSLPSPTELSSSVTAASTQARLAEVQNMLERWWALYQRYVASTGGQANCPMMQATLVVFHLISLNTVVDFPSIERIARKENLDGTYPSLCWAHKRAIFDVETAVFHCGQILMLVRNMPRGVTPPWWPAAIYRVALILWANSLVQKESTTANSGFANTFSIDAVAPDHPFVVRYLSKQEATPTLSKRDGTPVELNNSFVVLSHCIEVIQQTVTTRFAEGICNKLMKVASTKF